MKQIIITIENDNLDFEDTHRFEKLEDDIQALLNNIGDLDGTIENDITCNDLSFHSRCKNITDKGKCCGECE